MSGQSGGVLKGSYREQQYRIPGDGNVISAICQIKQPLISSDEKSKTITIPIPEGEGRLEEKIEFQDCTLYLTGIKKLDERYDYGTDKNNQKITKPMVYLSARVENKTEGKYLDWVLGCQTGEKTPLITIPEFTEAKDWTQRELLGFKAPYDEEAAELQLQFENPRFLWDQEFVLPVGIKGNEKHVSTKPGEEQAMIEPTTIHEDGPDMIEPTTHASDETPELLPVEESVTNQN